VKFDKKLLDYDYGDDEEEDHNDGVSNQNNQGGDALPALDALGKYVLINFIWCRKVKIHYFSAFLQTQLYFDSYKHSK
jgi:hypothetical protein